MPRHDAHVVAQPRPRLTQARYQKGWSQQELAQQLGTTALNVSRWERGLTTPTAYFRQKLTSVFGLSSAELGLQPELTLVPPSTAKAEPLASSTLYDPLIPVLPMTHSLIGRDAILTHLIDRLLASRSFALSALNGLPGVGKTTLAVALVQEEAVRRHFDGGILWAGLGPVPNVQSVLSHWGMLLGMGPDEAKLLTTSEAWAKALRAMIGQHRFLLVLDDVWQLEDALTCQVGGPHCSFILTTRFPQIALSFAHSESVTVEELNETDSLALLQQLAPLVVEHEPEQTRALARATGGLPLALTLIGNYLRIQSYSGQPRRIQSALAHMFDTTQRLQLIEPRSLNEEASTRRGQYISLQAVIALSDRQLHPEGQQALRALSVFAAKPNSFSEEAALAVCATEAETLDMLSDAGLLESAGSGRYMLHQSVVDYGQLHRTSTGPMERLIAYCIAYVQRNTRDHNALERERSMLQVALETLVKRPDTDFVSLSLSLAPFWRASGDYALATRYLEQAQDVAQQLEHRQELIRAWLYLGDIAEQCGDFVQAQACAKKGFALAQQEGDTDLVCTALITLSDATRKLENYTQAEQQARQGLDLAECHNYVYTQAHLLRSLGQTLYLQGQIEHSMDACQRGLELATQVDDYELMCTLLNNMGGVAGQLGDHIQTEAYFQKGLQLARKMGYRHWESYLLSNLGQLYGEHGQYKKAAHVSQESLLLARKKGNPTRLGIALFSMGILEVKRGNYQEAERYLQEGLPIVRQIKYFELLCLSCAYSGYIELERGNYLQAEQYFQEGSITARQVGFSHGLSIALIGLAQTAILCRSATQAEQYMQEGLTLARQQRDDQFLYEMFALLARAAIMSQEYVLAEQYVQESLPHIDKLKSHSPFYSSLLCQGELFLHKQQWKQAKTVFQQILVEDSEQRHIVADAHFGLARIALAHNNPQEARRHAEISLELYEAMQHQKVQEARRWLEMLDQPTDS